MDRDRHGDGDKLGDRNGDGDGDRHMDRHGDGNCDGDWNGDGDGMDCLVAMCGCASSGRFKRGVEEKRGNIQCSAESKCYCV